MLEARGRDFLRENGSYEVRAQSKEREGKERKVDKRLSFEVKKKVSFWGQMVTKREKVARVTVKRKEELKKKLKPQDDILA